MAVRIKRPNSKIDLSAIEDLEARIGAKLPEDYRGFLLAHNGGQAEHNEFGVTKQNDTAGVNVFYGLTGTKASGDLDFERRLLLNRLPAHILPVGDASCGNCVCLSLRPDSYGHVFFWDHELEEKEGDAPTFSNLFRVAESFQGFLGSLRPFDPDRVRLKPGQVKRVWVDPSLLRSLKSGDKESQP